MANSIQPVSSAGVNECEQGGEHWGGATSWAQRSGDTPPQFLSLPLRALGHVPLPTKGMKEAWLTATLIEGSVNVQS